jgi:hypothetical protein
MKTVAVRVVAMLIVWAVEIGLAYLYYSLGFLDSQSESGIFTLAVIALVAIYGIHVTAKIWSREWPSC